MLRHLFDMSLLHKPEILLVLACSRLRDACQTQLEMHGYRVLATDYGKAAMAFLREVPVPPALLIVDLATTDVPASEIAALASRRGVRVLPLASHRFAGDKDDGFTVVDVMHRVRDVLGQTSDPVLTVASVLSGPREQRW